MTFRFSTARPAYPLRDVVRDGLLVGTCLVMVGCEPRSHGDVSRPSVPQPTPAKIVPTPETVPAAPVPEPQLPPPAPPAPDWAPTINSVITEPDGRCLLALAGPTFPPGSTLDITDHFGAPVGSALVLDQDAGKPPLARLIGLTNASRPITPGDHLRIHEEPKPKPVAPPPEHASEDPGHEAIPPGSLADLERLAKAKDLPVVQGAHLARLESERRWLELAARILRLPAGGPELSDLQERLRRELADHPEMREVKP